MNAKGTVALELRGMRLTMTVEVVQPALSAPSPETGAVYEAEAVESADSQAVIRHLQGMPPRLLEALEAFESDRLAALSALLEKSRDAV